MKLESVKKKTSIGNSVRSRPKSKNAKRDYKKYRGQGKQINIRMAQVQYNEGFDDAQSVNNSKRDSFLYKDLNLFFSPNPVTKDISKVTDVQAIKRSVRNLVLLNPGEKPFHPEVGTGVRASLFENFGPIELSALRTRIEYSINKFEPRVTLQQVDFGLVETALDNNALNCRISFTINNAPDRLEEVDLMLQRIR